VVCIAVGQKWSIWINPWFCRQFGERRKDTCDIGSGLHMSSPNDTNELIDVAKELNSSRVRP
jgi:hypothetical protein